MISRLKPRSVPAFRRNLLRWYEANKRALPWRKTRDPYKIWVSEIMLQQTRVAAATAYYRRFLKAFPTVAVLAAASEQQVLAQWSGLGYYRRARMLHAAAKTLTAEKRPMPRNAEELRDLPGIGRYTAAAIASIAFGEAVAVVDGNVERVLLRTSGLAESSDADHWSAAQELIDAERPGDFNQAMMELGATVCLPKKPLCGSCPVKRWCGTRGEHTAKEPVARKRAEVDYLLVTKMKRIALVQRPHDSRSMAGMWELPRAKARSTKEPLLRLKHSITTTDYVVNVWPGKAPTGSIQLFVRDAAKLPLTGLTRKILRRLDLLKI
jgi:A/G-specific adenine glycosylase